MKMLDNGIDICTKNEGECEYQMLPDTHPRILLDTNSESYV